MAYAMLMRTKDSNGGVNWTWVGSGKYVAAGNDAQALLKDFNAWEHEGWKVVGVGDFNGDGADEILLQR